jgi:hypothetical protein
VRIPEEEAAEGVDGSPISYTDARCILPPETSYSATAGGGCEIRLVYLSSLSADRRSRWPAGIFRIRNRSTARAEDYV